MPKSVRRTRGESMKTPNQYLLGVLKGQNEEQRGRIQRVDDKEIFQI